MKYSSFRKAVELLAMRQAHSQEKVSLVQSEQDKKTLLSELEAISKDARDMFYIEIPDAPDVPILQDPSAASLVNTIRDNLQTIKMVRSFK